MGRAGSNRLFTALQGRRWGFASYLTLFLVFEMLMSEKKQKQDCFHSQGDTQNPRTHGNPAAARGFRLFSLEHSALGNAWPGPERN